ncbi:sugar phosphate isomerase/epimerase [Paenibacillus sp. N4]|uniref:sugar phosphate isomerase/epimerase family protein n=1 Tax=Paenibacillus vietnamensis TaxID=2590547 RepID=UPI001CD0AC6C|nr:sugar phosphate isomerase/epimerase [Paenibacillus vietnamensis]MCA0755908.1 sugar phosphate isomerase/epimerase [Paenibacillus vietnamensis]
MKIGIADYGMYAWDGGHFDFEARALALKHIGYDGIERLTAFHPEEAIRKSAFLRRNGLSFATVRGPSVELSVQWASGLGRDYVWTEVTEKSDFDVFCRQVNIMAEHAERWGIRVALHNHMGTLVETQEQLESFLERCPSAGLVFDTAHLAAMGGDAERIAALYADRLLAIHVKDWLLTDPDAGVWHKRGRFCGLGKGNIGMNNLDILNAATAAGYEGWIFVEHDTHLREPLEDLAESRDYLRKGGY